MGCAINFFFQTSFVLFFFSRVRYRDKNDDLQTVETINNFITCDAEKKPDLYISKPMNNCVAQLRENVVSIGID